MNYVEPAALCDILQGCAGFLLLERVSGLFPGFYPSVENFYVFKSLFIVYRSLTDCTCFLGSGAVEDNFIVFLDERKS